MTPPSLHDRVAAIIADEPVVDMHTHLYPPAFGSPVPTSSTTPDPHGLALWGIDELLTYHYLIAEVFRVVPASELPYDTFWSWPKPRQADHIWQHLFLDRAPLSEATRGVLTTLAHLGLDPNERDLNQHRKWFAEQDLDNYIDTVMQRSGVTRITMTNNVFDENERTRWLADRNVGSDPRFAPVLRFDELLTDWPAAAEVLASLGYKVLQTPDEQSLTEARRFLTDWIARMRPVYTAVSLPPTFRYASPDANPLTTNMLEQVVLPVCRDHDLPFAMMIGTLRQVNPALRSAGDMLAKADAASVARLCAAFPDNRFLVTMLSRESQHELCVAARKFSNLMIFGCWWFLNNPSIITEITTERFELLGSTFVPQHSDARVLDQLLYKWSHSRTLIASVLADMYQRTADTGYVLTDEHIRADARRLLSGNYLRILGY
ncbi:glucuronate isomerase [Mucisphaera sp.]|uniref:glucuronate isomerase n=1 Tax=Mucisphaera sp. TaxID=2913024 RepID=UPI003D0D5080